ncbi:MAG: Gfo/Idh/MocA family oxidoreductase [Chloroflexota bacterium]
MKKTYRAAIIGLGRMGSTFDDEIARGGAFFLPYAHAPSYVESPLVELVAAADLHPEQREIFGERWGLSQEHLYSDYNEMLAQEQIDIVSVCTTLRHRCAIIEEIVQSGVKAIWSEKPLAATLAEADTIVRVCDATGVAIAVNCQRRWHPLFNEVKQMIVAGELGQVLQINLQGTFGLSNNGSHILDIIRYLAGGEVEWVFGEMASDEMAMSDEEPMGNGYLAFDNGVRSFVRSMKSGAAMMNFEIIGEQGIVRTFDQGMSWEMSRIADSDPDSHSVRPPSLRFPRPLSVRYPFPLPNRIQGIGLTIVEDLVASIETGSSPRCSAKDAAIALEIAIAMRESHRRGGVKVTLPLEDRSLRMLSNDMRGDALPRRVRDQGGKR